MPPTTSAATSRTATSRRADEDPDGRETPEPGAGPDGSEAAASAPATATAGLGPIRGVRSRSREEAIKTAFDQNRYDQWQFTVELFQTGGGAAEPRRRRRSPVAGGPGISAQVDRPPDPPGRCSRAGMSAARRCRDPAASRRRTARSASGGASDGAGDGPSARGCRTPPGLPLPGARLARQRRRSTCAPPSGRRAGARARRRARSCPPASCSRSRRLGGAGPAAQRPRPAPRRHAAQRPGHHRQRLPRRGRRHPGQPRQRAVRHPRGDRIAQLVIAPVARVEWEEAESSRPARARAAASAPPDAS